MSARQSSNDPFNLDQVSSITKLKSEIPEGLSIFSLFSNINKIDRAILNQFNAESIIDFEINNFQEGDSLILFSDGPLNEDFINAMSCIKKLKFGEIAFELNAIIIYKSLNGRSKWSGNAHSRHEKQFKKYWH